MGDIIFIATSRLKWIKYSLSQFGAFYWIKPIIQDLELTKLKDPAEPHVPDVVSIQEELFLPSSAALVLQSLDLQLAKRVMVDF